MNTDKLIADTFKNRTSSLDLSQERFEEMLEYIESQSQVKDASYFSKLLYMLCQFKTIFHRKQLMQVALVVLIIICLPMLIKNIKFTGLSKSSSESPSSHNSASSSKGGSSYENNYGVPSESKTEDSITDNTSVEKEQEHEKKFITLVLTPKEFAQEDNLLNRIQDLEHFFSQLESIKAAFVELNDVTIAKKPTITKGEASGTLLINGTSMSAKDAIKIRVLVNSDTLFATLAANNDISYTIMVLDTE